MYYDFFTPLHPFLDVIGWIVVIWLVVALLRSVGSGGRRHHWMWDEHEQYHHHRHEGRALEVLKERYAKGEISKEEFDLKKKDIEA